MERKYKNKYDVLVFLSSNLANKTEILLEDRLTDK